MTTYDIALALFVVSLLAAGCLWIARGGFGDDD